MEITKNGLSFEEVKEKYELKVSNLLKELGIPVHIKGYWYIRYAILASIGDISLIDCVMKLLYPKVAKEFDTTPSKVERAIRHAINVAYINSEHTLYFEIFKNTLTHVKTPSNGQFIATLADYIKLNY